MERRLGEPFSAFLHALKADPHKDHRHRIEHILSPTIKVRDLIAKSGVVLSTHPQWIYKWFDRARLLQHLDGERGVVPPHCGQLGNKILAMLRQKKSLERFLKIQFLKNSL